MREAGLAVWVLTGDKLQTALEISRSCNLIKNDDDLIILSEDHPKSLLEKISQLKASPMKTEESLEQTHTCMGKVKKFLVDFFMPRKPVERVHRRVILIDGKNLQWALEGAKKTFIEIASKCDAVVCCRVTPLQKSGVVQLVSQIIGEKFFQLLKNSQFLFFF